MLLRFYNCMNLVNKYSVHSLMWCMAHNLVDDVVLWLQIGTFNNSEILVYFYEFDRIK